ncbi:MAG: hypothetical protein ACI4JA_02025 [Oscillospiraceae bacterium]
MKQNVLSIIDGFICAVIFNITAYLGAGIASIISILIFCIIFGGFHIYRTSKYEKLPPFVFYTISSALFTVFIYILTLHFPLFYNIFVSANPDYGKPNAGSGFGMVISLYFNCVEYIVIIFIGFIKLLSKKLISKLNNNDENSSH